MMIQYDDDQGKQCDDDRGDQCYNDQGDHCVDDVEFLLEDLSDSLQGQ